MAVMELFGIYFCYSKEKQSETSEEHLTLGSLCFTAEISFIRVDGM